VLGRQLFRSVFVDAATAEGGRLGPFIQPSASTDDQLALVVPDRCKGLSTAELTTGAPGDRTGQELFTREFTEPLVSLVGHTLSEDEQEPHNPLSSRLVQQDAQHCEGSGDAADHAQPE
jgi:hypothetical protein